MLVVDLGPADEPSPLEENELCLVQRERVRDGSLAVEGEGERAEIITRS